MPVDLIFHKGNTFSLNGFGNDAGWFALAFLRCHQGVVNGFIVMSVNAENIPSESTEFVLKRSRTDYLGCRAVDLQAVFIDNGTQIVAVIMGGSHGCFPDLAFFRLTVADQAVDAVGISVQFIGQAHADSG